MTPTRGRIVIITGGRGAGKTRLCLRLAERARAYGWRVAGAACPAVVQAGEKTGIVVQDLRSGETRRLAQRLTPGSA
ncbi:MAG TPA: nucleoside-triphosphatase, partial [Anaerolineaceae bacterium]|nr:nucleoside-triphosphatase [Anaerolineaceae bacterium]